jgi:hypothetical protein
MFSSWIFWRKMDAIYPCQLTSPLQRSTTYIYIFLQINLMIRDETFSATKSLVIFDAFLVGDDKDQDRSRSVDLIGIGTIARDGQ